MSEILIPDTDKKTYYERNKEEISKKMKEYYKLNRDKIVEKRKTDRDNDRDKYNNYMKNLTNKLLQDEEYKKKRLEQKRIISTKHRLLKRGDEPMKKRGRKPKVNDTITTEIIV
jgi:hypothetical protein